MVQRKGEILPHAANANTKARTAQFYRSPASSCIQVLFLVGINRQSQCSTGPDVFSGDEPAPHQAYVDLLKVALTTAHGFCLEQVHDFAEAAAYCEEHNVDVALADLFHKDAREPGLIERVQGIIGSSVALVMLGDGDNEKLALEGLQLGAQDHLNTRTLNPETLRRALRYAVARKKAEQRLARLAHYDTLTGLANRATFLDRLEHGLARSRRQKSRLAVMFLDLDRFKSINDNLGHNAGDELLRMAGGRVSKCVREYDTVARLGGDEFAVLLDTCLERAGPHDVAQRIMDIFQVPFRLGDLDLVVTSSIGVAVCADGDVSGEVLMKAADAAMYQAKRSGRNQFNVDVLSGTGEGPNPTSLETELRRAMHRNSYLLHFQPQFDMRGERFRGAEALIRLERDDGSLMPPMEFIPLLEDTGLIWEVGAWIVQEACRVLASWRADGYLDCIMAMNLSARQFQRPGLADIVASALARSNVPAECLELEITESMLMRDIAMTNETFAELKGLGVRIAIDDFGTGYSSLAYLHRFDVDALKIDMSLVHSLSSSSKAALLTGAVVGLGHNLGLDVVAEGVETQEQFDFLQQAGCDVAQGFLLGKPKPAVRPDMYLQASPIDSELKAV